MEMEIAHLTLNSLMIVAAMFALGVVVLVLCTGLRINPFREKTTSFLLAVFGGLIGLASIKQQFFCKFGETSLVA
jgi:hypothetical protein